MKAIIFDCFGVLTTDAWLPFKNKYFGHDSELLKQATDLNKQSDSGLIGPDDFVAAIAELAHVTPNEVATTISGNVPNDELFTYIQTLEPNYKIGMRSNAASNWLDRLFTPEQNALFEAIVLSCDTGFIKPDPRAYEAIIAKLDVQPEDCVFIDDQERYITGAKELGMATIWYQDFTQMKRELEVALAK